jgi:hypothetical protein
MAKKGGVTEAWGTGSSQAVEDYEPEAAGKGKKNKKGKTVLMYVG